MKRRNDEIAAQWDARKTARKPLFSAYEKADEGKASKSAPPPSLETLLEHDAPVGQMVRLHGITEEEAYALKRDFEEEKAFKLLDVNKAKPGSGAVDVGTGIVDDIATTIKRERKMGGSLR